MSAVGVACGFDFVAVLLLAALVVISAGHEGRPASCARFPEHRCNLGAAGERRWTPVVADEATRVLRAHGVRVVRLPADFRGIYRVDAAIFIHFDGATKRCSSAASIGYRSAAGARAAGLWRSVYSRYWPFGFKPDNFTVGLHHYYGFRQMETSEGSLVLELGELTCPPQRAWLAPRLRFEGDLLAAFLSKLIGQGQVPLPANRSPR